MISIGFILLAIGAMQLIARILLNSNYRVLLWTEPVFVRISQKLEEHFIFISPQFIQQIFVKSVFLFTLVCVFFEYYKLLLIVFLLTFVFPTTFFLALYKRRKMLIVNQFHAWLPTIHGLLQSGQSLEKALRLSISKQKPPISQDLELVLKETEVGKSLEEAFHMLTKRYRHPDLELFATALAMSKKTGAPLIELLESCLSLIKKRKDFSDRLLALTTQCRIQARIGTALPVLLFLTINLISPEHLDIFWKLDSSFLIFSACIAALILGVIWIQRLSRIHAPW